MASELAAVLANIREAEAAAKAKAASDYADLVGRCVAGDDLDPDDVLEVLTAAGRTAEELSGDVTRAEELTAAEAVFAELPARRAASDQAAKAVEEAARWYDAEVAKLVKRVHVAQAEHQAMQSRVMEAQAAKVTVARLKREQEQADAKRGGPVTFPRGQRSAVEVDEG